ncbi:megakaryocyte and platelet inhibitory receptor G6b [Emys orbicularis]|uniref:megakaryocyte and platelet inhibitory receptor G6b n=1 Tax=Emys orbicularis TaxID=82168 RepID=UPI0031FCFF7A
MGSAVWVLLALLAPGPLLGSSPRLEVRGARGQILLPCGARGPRLRWVWSPRYPKCAGDPGDQLEIAHLPPRPEPPLDQFKGRLDPHPSGLGALLLRDLVMSDSGTFTCHGESGAEPPIQLEVTGGTDRIKTKKRTKQEPPGPVYAPWKSHGLEPNQPKDAPCPRVEKEKSQAPCFTLKSSTHWWLEPQPLPHTAPRSMPLLSDPHPPRLHSPLLSTPS